MTITPQTSAAASGKILLVDDEPHITHVLSRRLERRGYAVRVARDGQEGLRLAGEWRPHLIISDLQMPRLDGLSMAERLRAAAETEWTPIIMISGRGFLLDADRLRRTNITEVLEKPFSAEAVLELAERIIGWTDRPREAAA